MIKKLHYKNRGEWMAIRNELSGINTTDTCRLGASSAGSVMGKNKWSSPIRSYYELIGIQQPNAQTLDMVMGLETEPLIEKMYRCYDADTLKMADNLANENYVNPIDKCDFILSNDVFLCSLDWIIPSGFSLGDGEFKDLPYPADGKHVRYMVHSKWNGQIPENYQIQLEIQARMLGSNYAELIVFCEKELFIYPYYCNDELWETIQYECKRFADRVIAAKQAKSVMESEPSEKDYYLSIIHSLEPDVTALEDEEELINQMNGNTTGLIIQGCDIAQQHRNTYLEAMDLAKKAEAIKQENKNGLLRLMNGAEKMELPEGVIINRVNGRKFFSVK